jgi:hypothetical protein
MSAEAGPQEDAQTREQEHGRHVITQRQAENEARPGQPGRTATRAPFHHQAENQGHEEDVKRVDLGAQRL